MNIYVIGSLRNGNIPRIGSRLREAGVEVFDDWYAAGERADDSWKEYEEGRGRGYKEALRGYAAKHVFDFDLYHLNRADGCLLVAPAGKSGHLEFGFMRGMGKPGWVLLEPDNARWDVMYQFATDVFFSEDEMIYELQRQSSTTTN